MKSIHNTLALPVLPLYTVLLQHCGPSRRTQSFTNSSSVGPYHVLQFFKNCYSTGLFCGVRSFRNRWLQCGSPMGYSSCQKNCPSINSPSWVTVPARSLLQHGLCRGCSFLQGPSTSCSVESFRGCRVDACSNIVLHGLLLHPTRECRLESCSE